MKERNLYLEVLTKAKETQSSIGIKFRYDEDFIQVIPIEEVDGWISFKLNQDYSGSNTGDILIVEVGAICMMAYHEEKKPKYPPGSIYYSKNNND